MSDQPVDYYYRELTWLYTDDDEIEDNERMISQTGSVIGFSILTAAFVGTAIMNIRVTSASRAFYEWNAIRLILPAIQWVLAMESATLAVDAGHQVADQWAIAVYMLQATVAPGIFLATFVITFLAYRNRQIPFCLVHRGPSRGPNAHPADDDEVAQPLVRPATMVVIMRLFAIFLFLVTLVVNFDVVWNTSDSAGRTGWATVVRTPWNGSVAHVVMSLLPIALVSICCMYFSFLLWRYGSFFSMKIYPSVINPWCMPMFGTFCLAGGQCFGPDLFPLMSRVGILLYQLCFLRVMYEVRHDIKLSGDLGGFLDALGDDNVTGSVAAMEVSATANESGRQLNRDFSLPEFH
jgi:hypothetical protein